MLLRHPQAVILDAAANDGYWEPRRYPDWAAVNAMRFFPNQPPGHGVEPHYHDGDELWLFTAGQGEVWLDGRVHAITPNTVVYTPMGVNHRFQMFTPSETVAIVTPLERRRRTQHITVAEDGPPEPTVAGFVVAGSANAGPLATPGPRCPLSEFRLLTLTAGAEPTATVIAPEYWLVLDGHLVVELAGMVAELVAGDLALFPAGAVRRVRSPGGGRIAVARQRRGADSAGRSDAG